jgi:large subunit ribosomal protein L15
MKLTDLRPAPGATTSKKRVGRGKGSGLGKTSGKGHKGLRARSGGGTPPGYEGGQMPMQRRIPKRGFTNIFRKEYAIVHVKDLNRFAEGEPIDPVLFVACGMVKDPMCGIKLLADGELVRPVTVTVHKASKAAIEKVRAAGGTVEVLLPC